MNLNEMISIDLPSLQSITLGKYTLQGESDNEKCSLTMRSNNEMIKLNEFRSSYFKIHQFCKWRKSQISSNSKIGKY